MAVTPARLLAFLRASEPSDLASILRLAGWLERVGGDERRSFWSAPPDKPPEALVLPMLQTLADYDLRIREVADALARVYGDEVSALIEIVSVDFDVLRMRAGQRTDATGSIPFEEGYEFVSGLRDMLRAAAKATSERRPYFGNRNFQLADRFVNELRLGQSDQGSYVFTLLSPISSPSFEVSHAGPTLELDERFGRSVTMTLMRALRSARDAADEYLRSRDFGVFMQAVSDGVSADLCDSIVEVLAPPSQTEVSVQVHWAKKVPISDLVTEEVTFSRELLPPLESASARFKSTQPQARRSIRGVIRQMTKEELQEGSPFVVSLSVLEGLDANLVRVRFEFEYLNEAVEAFKRGYAVSVTGDVEREGNIFWLYNPEGITVAPEGSPAGEQRESLLPDDDPN